VPPVPSLITRVAGATIVAAVTLFTSSCGSGSKSDNHSTTKLDEPVINGEPAGYNSDDMDFSNHVIPCQQQELEIEAQAAERASNPQVTAFAIKDASTLQTDMQILKALLAQWYGGQDDPSGNNSPPAPMHGAIDDATMAKFDSVQGKPFDALFLTTMIQLNDAIIRLATTETSKGKNIDAINTAKQIITSTQADTHQLQQMLGH
jgi:uncharacterized protein (DUF305 family)